MFGAVRDRIPCSALLWSARAGSELSVVTVIYSDTIAPSTGFRSMRTLRSLSATTNSAVPQFKQIFTSGNSKTMGFLRPSKPWKCIAISLVKDLRGDSQRGQTMKPHTTMVRQSVIDCGTQF